MQPLEVSFRISRQLLCIQYGFLWMAVVAIWTLTPPFSLYFCLVFKSALVVLLMTYFLLSSIYEPVITQLLYDGTTWQLSIKDVGVLRAALAGDTVLLRKMLVLRFQIPGRYRKLTCIVLPDSLPAKDFHALLLAASW